MHNNGYSLVLLQLRKYINRSGQCFIGYPNTSNFASYFQLSLFRYPDETLSPVFDILLMLLLIGNIADDLSVQVSCPIEGMASGPSNKNHRCYHGCFTQSLFYKRDINNLLLLGHRSLIKKITQTAVMNIVFQCIFIELDVSYASQHTFSKVTVTIFETYIYILKQ